MPRKPRLVVLCGLGLADLLDAVPALRALARAFPGHRRLLVAPSWLASLLPLIVEQGELCIDELVECEGLEADPGALPGWPEVAVNLHGPGPESHRLLLETGPVELISFRHEAVAETVEMPPWRPAEPAAERWCRLLRSARIPADRAELGIRRPDAEAPSWIQGATLVHPGVASVAGRRSAARWGGTATAAGLDDRSVLAEPTDLFTLATHVAAAGVVICGDAGVARLATALGVPSVVVSDAAPA